VYFLAASVVNGYMSLSFISYWSITLVISYFTCVSLGKNYFIAFEHVVVFLSIIGLILWGAYLLSPDTVMRVIKLLRFSNWYEEGRTDVINIVVFTLLDRSNTDLGFYLFYRNSGFAFEPGAYACFLCFAIVCNILRNGGLRIIKNYSLIILFVSLFSTESTTGGIILIFVFIIYVLSNYKSKRKYLYLVLLIPLVLWIISLEFVGDKFLNEYDSSRTLSYSSGDDDGTGRIMSFLLYFEEFKARPIFGLAGDPHTLLAAHNYASSVHSGLGFLLSQFGSIMSLVFIYLCLITKRVVNFLFNYNSWILLVVLYGSMISYSIWTYPSFFTFVIFGVFFPYYYIKKRKYENYSRR
jgi:hypothetical protein